ncbi:MAG: hypothetical protein QJR12_07460 [Mycobacterium sp.]|uniref:hypothetical protein n=1 Tax=Mycobacterium sp. TaxID=1785 RepID=UPI002606BE10|nr:hypothetical protein [Mycobacterium sp.]MDI3314111.1 hypothetical protein [Mycobacterium sp.]
MTTVDDNCLAGVSATTLRTRRARAAEAKRPYGVVDDPWAVQLFGLVGAVDYDRATFGKPRRFHPRRALAHGVATADRLGTHPKASVVAPAGACRPVSGG